VGTELRLAVRGGGGGIVLESRGKGDIGCGGSNVIEGVAMVCASSDCALARLAFGWDGFVLWTVLFSDVYMTATLVEGEFMVPVSDHPIAVPS